MNNSKILNIQFGIGDSTINEYNNDVACDQTKTDRTPGRGMDQKSISDRDHIGKTL